MGVKIRNLKNETLKNISYRRVILTNKHLQLVLMTLQPGETIPLEIHKTLDQFIRVEHGVLNGKIEGKEFKLKNGEFVIVPAGERHVFWNNSSHKKSVHLFTLYSRPNHPSQRIQKRQPYK